MESYKTQSGLAFALADDPRVYTTSSKIARVPLSDYCLDDSAHNLPGLLSSAQLDGPASDSETLRRTHLSALQHVH